MFKLSARQLNPTRYLPLLKDPTLGAMASFEGWVRNHHQHKPVVALEYEAQASLCHSQANEILDEARKKFAIGKAIAVHRTGRLKVGEMAVWVGVSAQHRSQALGACRYIIDQLKIRLPIWKKEIFLNGPPAWVNCEHKDQALNYEQYYSQQTILKDISQQGQKRLAQAKVLVIGAGGLGCPALTSLTQAGVGTIGICDDDIVAVSNLHRQSLYTTSDLGVAKVFSAAARLQGINPFVRIIPINEKFSADNALRCAKDFDIILDCTDNFTAKFLLNDFAVIYQKILIQASIYQFEGKLRFYVPGGKCACLRCLWPKTVDDHCIGTCTQAGVIGVVANMLGHMQAFEAIRYIIKGISELMSHMLLFDLNDYTLRKIKESPNSDCPACSRKAVITDLKSHTNSQESKSESLEIKLNDIPSHTMNRYTFIDVRDESERPRVGDYFKKFLVLPLQNPESMNYPFDPKKEYLVFCAKGLRSSRFVQSMRSRGLNNLRSITGGVQAIQKYFKGKES